MTEENELTIPKLEALLYRCMCATKVPDIMNWIEAQIDEAGEADNEEIKKQKSESYKAALADLMRDLEADYGYKAMEEVIDIICGRLDNLKNEEEEIKYSYSESDLRKIEEACAYCGGEEFYTVNPIWIPDHWKAAHKHGLCVKCTNIYKEELRKREEEARKEGFEAGRLHETVTAPYEDTYYVFEYFDLADFEMRRKGK